MGGLRSAVDVLYNALVNSPNVVLTRYPLLPNAGIALTGSGATTGAYKFAAAGAGQVQVVTAAINATGMWVCAAGLGTPGAMDQYVLWIGRGTVAAAVVMATLDFAGLLTAGAAAAIIVACVPKATSLPYPVYVRAGVGIALDLANAAAADNTAVGHIIVATGLGA